MKNGRQPCDPTWTQSHQMKPQPIIAILILLLFGRGWIFSLVRDRKP